MKKDINPPKVEDVAVAIIPEDNELGEQEWNAYLINMRDETISGVLVSTRGYGTNARTDEKVKTSMLRHFLDTIEPNDFKKIEPITPDVLGLSNEFWVSFYYDKTMYDKKYIFMAESINEENFINVPVIDKPGVMIK